MATRIYVACLLLITCKYVYSDTLLDLIKKTPNLSKVRYTQN